ncbi:hypothetical protein PPERSA_04616 [Pseudocohnilembus persalinus]|uniref:Uncharacterized protein n=1 Tax=Pseudocohnilembus persalinus TaxID=266149 RepID=A0A0V0QNU9_PSEPJ|nr:hypothetical protein PPERSA_04616 [Pseudocohnilembus persalinus]|eukprot:KRX03821.1 hypothetical protein PPERSA_04616 [Pseudocohnilembus persalinus]
MEQLNTQTESNNQELKCLQQTHEELPIQCFKFTDKIELMLQCIQCMLEDPDSNGKVMLKQLLEYPIYKIKNYPPFLEKDLQKKIQNNFQEFTPEKLKEFKQQTQDQITDFFEETKEKYNESLNLKKKEIFLQLDEVFQLMNIFELYDVEPIKNALNLFKSKEYQEEDLFLIQKDLKEKFQKSNLNLDLQEFMNKTNTRLQDMKKQINQHLESFNKNLDTVQTYSYENYGINNKFFKSNFNTYQSQNDIIIENYSRTIKFQDNILNQYKQVYSQPLEKNKTYTYKIQVKLFGSQQQRLYFSILRSQDKDNQEYMQQKFGQSGNNYIQFENSSCIQLQQNSQQLQTQNQNANSSLFVQQQNNSLFEQQQQQNHILPNGPRYAIINIIFNYNQQLFQLHYDNKVVKKKKFGNDINGDNLFFGINLLQDTKDQATEINIIDYTCF